MATIDAGSKSQALQRIDRSLYPFEHRWADIDGHRIHYVDEGTGPTLLLLHGNPTWSFVYRDVIRGLRDSFRCIAVDYPGFGLSSAGPGYRFTPAEHSKAIEGLVHKLDLHDVTLMVHDWGGPIGLGVAVRNPERFRAFVIGNTFAWPVNGDPKLEGFSKLMGGPIGWFGIRYFNAFVNLLIPIGMGRKRPDRNVMEHYRLPFRGSSRSRVPTFVFPRAILSSRAYLEQVAAGLPAITDRPALIVWGDRDPAFQVKERERFERLFPNHQTVVLEGAAHYIQEDAPEEIIGAIRDWMPSTAAG
ncbi:MAG TPA: alpha/beta fold hydrolase [Herpetosiphonaceae bacterium]|nr:alpha/beta fold hydrolase [Herpetosiphonaceae bacterium]